MKPISSRESASLYAEVATYVAMMIIGSAYLLGPAHPYIVLKPGYQCVAIFFLSLITVAVGTAWLGQALQIEIFRTLKLAKE